MRGLLNTTAPWRIEILRQGEGEGGGGAGAGDGGASTDAPAFAEDRTAKLEQRFDRLAQSVDGFISQTREREQLSAAANVEARIKQAENKATADVDAAESALADAFDDGDGRTIAKAQRVLSEATAEQKRIQVLAADAREKIKASEKRDGGKRSDDGNQGDMDTTNLDGWKAKHASWYGVDTEMTKAAHEFDAQIRTAGVLEPGSSQYFDAVDRQMRQKFPDRFNDTPPTAGGGSSAPSGGGQQRIAASVAEGYRRMGINIDDPDVAKRMVKNREAAVRKGWLPEKPVSGRILTR